MRVKLSPSTISKIYLFCAWAPLWALIFDAVGSGNAFLISLAKGHGLWAFIFCNVVELSIVICLFSTLIALYLLVIFVKEKNFRLIFLLGLLANLYFLCSQYLEAFPAITSINEYTHRIQTETSIWQDKVQTVKICALEGYAINTIFKPLINDWESHKITFVKGVYSSFMNENCKLSDALNLPTDLISKFVGSWPIYSNGMSVYQSDKSYFLRSINGDSLRLKTPERYVGGDPILSWDFKFLAWPNSKGPVVVSELQSLKTSEIEHDFLGFSPTSRLIVFLQKGSIIFARYPDLTILKQSQVLTNGPFFSNLMVSSNLPYNWISWSLKTDLDMEEIQGKKGKIKIRWDINNKEDSIELDKGSEVDDVSVSSDWSKIAIAYTITINLPFQYRVQSSESRVEVIDTLSKEMIVRRSFGKTPWAQLQQNQIVFLGASKFAYNRIDVKEGRNLPVVDEVVVEEVKNK